MHIILGELKNPLCKIEDLSLLIPQNRSGEGLNYGQGEGQFRIDEAKWGLYFAAERGYYVQFEEGRLTAREFLLILDEIIMHFQKLCGESIVFQGVWEDGKDGKDI